MKLSPSKDDSGKLPTKQRFWSASCRTLSEESCDSDTAQWMMKHFCTIFAVIAALAVAGTAFAQSDPFGALDRIYLDSLKAYPGQEIAIRVRLTNDEQLGALQIPLKYDSSALRIRGISYVGSCCEYIQTKITNPPSMDSVGGHFMLAIIRIGESHAITTGDSLVCTIQFTVSPTAIPGSVVLIDTLAYPPSGGLVLSEQSGVSIRPAFRAGKVVVTPVNRAPEFATIPPPSVREGDSVKITFTVSDPDSDHVALTAIALPQGAQFTAGANGTGLAAWRPDFNGPFSSSGSPFKFSIQASDGKLTVNRDLFVTVTNVNRPPKVVIPAAITVEAGNPLSFAVSASDPDLDSLALRVITSPSGSVFDNTNPGLFSWVPPVTDSGMKNIAFVATDLLGMTDTGRIAVTVLATTLYALTADTLSSYPADTAVVQISLENKLPVSGFNLLLSYDATILSIIRATKASTRVSTFEYYSVTLDEGGNPGRVRIIASAALSGTGTPLPAGTGPISSLTFRLSENLDYVGMSAPIRYLFLDAMTQNDNTLKDQMGAKIPQGTIVYHEGSVSVLSIGTILPGDINTNGVANDIADVVYFSNFLMNPTRFPFNPLQYANADVNGDGIAASVSDLVRLINNLLDGVAGAKVEAAETLQGTLSARDDYEGITFSYDARTSVGGMLLTFETDDQLERAISADASEQMTIETQQDGSTVRLLVYSREAKVMESGRHEVVTLPGIHGIRNLRIDASSGEGNVMTLALTAGDMTLPTGYALYQNYPNPFNPETRIAFDLPVSSMITLTVYDILGRQIRVLADRELPAGQHTMTWDGRTEDGSVAASGIYLYRLRASDWSQSRKMILLK